jgi:hypothetical protein
MADTILVVDFLEPMEWPTEFGRHDLGVFGDVAVLASVRVLGFEDEDIPSVHAPPSYLTKGCERTLKSQLSPMALAVAEREMTLRTSIKVAAHLRPKKRRERPATVVLCSMPCTVSTCRARLQAALESAGSFPAIERS